MSEIAVTGVGVVLHLGAFIASVHFGSGTDKGETLKRRLHFSVGALMILSLIAFVFVTKLSQGKFRTPVLVFCLLICLLHFVSGIIYMTDSGSGNGEGSSLLRPLALSATSLLLVILFIILVKMRV
jgi:hypothetical protein